MYQTDEFERFKKFKALDKHVVGSSPVLPREDSDEKFEWYNLQGESPVSSPPDANTILVDHGLDEDRLWNHAITLYNQRKVKNPYTAPDGPATQQSHAPPWGLKLSMPHFYKPEKIEKFHRHWGHRLGLEVLKMRQAALHGAWPDEETHKANEAEVSSYIEACEDYERGEKLKDVYVTDHVPATPKYLTGSDEEDDECRAYEASVNAYNSAGAGEDDVGGGLYRRGSLMQRILDPFAGAPRDADGAIVYNVTEEEMSAEGVNDQEVLKKKYEIAMKNAAVSDLDPEDEDAWREAVVDELSNERSPFDLEEFHAVLDKELAIFDKGEKYDYVKDLKDAHKQGLSQSLEAKIFATIPDHAFWDIKKPLQKGTYKRENRYNPFRGREYNDFFEMRDAEQYLDAHTLHRNLNNSVSKHQQY